MLKNQNECYDITEIVAEKAVRILLAVCRINAVKCNRINFSFHDFERIFVRRWKELMYKDFPYDYNSRMAQSTDLSKSKIRDICNKM